MFSKQYRERYKDALRLQRWPLVDTVKMEKEKKEIDMLDEELNQTEVKAKAIAHIVEIALNNLMKVDLSREEALAGILSQIAIQVDKKDLEFALDLNKKYHKSFLENVKK